jgi:hypothetical protein
LNIKTLRRGLSLRRDRIGITQPNILSRALGHETSRFTPAKLRATTDTRTPNGQEEQREAQE